MPKYNQSEILAAGALALGYIEVPATSRKYRTFAKDGDERRYYIGKAGAVRAGRNPSDSLASPMAKRLFMRKGEIALSLPSTVNALSEVDQRQVADEARLRAQQGGPR